MRSWKLLHAVSRAQRQKARDELLSRAAGNEPKSFKGMPSGALSELANTVFPEGQNVPERIHQKK